MASDDTLAWFEFLLNPTLLDIHLKKENPDPSAISLIVQFIYSGIKKIEGVSPDTEIVDISTRHINVKKKHIMTIIPLKLASYLNWDLELFCQNLPLHIQNALFTLLLEETLDDEMSNPVSHATLDTGPLLPYQLYSVSLYHRWALAALVRSKLPLKPTKVSNVPIPGQQDPMHESREMQDAILCVLERDVDHSVRILEQLLTAGEVHVITRQSFSLATNKGETEKHNWGQCKLIPDEQFKCQIHYDLGIYHFMQEKLGDAFHHFSEAVLLLKEIGPSPTYCYLKEEKLKAFYDSCANVCGRTTPVANRSLYHQFTYAVSNNLEGLIDTLIEDNLKNEIPHYLRQSLQLDLMTNEKAPEGLLFQVQTLNALRDVFEGNVWDSSYIVSLLQAGKQGAHYLIQMLASTLKQLSPTQRSLTRTFLVALCSTDGLSELLMSPLMACAPLLNLFEHEEIVRLWAGVKEQTDGNSKAFNATLGADFTNLNDLIWVLIHSYDPNILKKCCYGYNKAQPSQPNSTKKMILELNAKWESQIPIPVYNTINKVIPEPERSFILLLIAKAQELTLPKSFQQSLDLLNEASETANNIQERDTSRPCRMISWLMLVSNIQQQIHDLPCVEESEIRKLAAKSKQCLSAINSREGVVPWTNVIYWCRILLLNAQEWSSLLGPQGPSSSHFPLMQVIRSHAAAAQALQEKHSNKKPWQELFDLVTLILMNGNGPKRDSTGQNIDRHRDAGVVTYATFLEFLQTVKEPNCLSILVSLLGHIFNILCEEPLSSVHIEHINMWPSKISGMNCFRLVQDTLSLVVDHSTELYPLGSHISTSVCDSWFITKADLAFYQEKYHKAIQNYLSAIFVATDYLRNDSNIPEQNGMNDMVLKRMIRSCKKLGSYTQAAILCQFLQNIDYNTAIQCLQERNAIDAMDAYYNCLWDVTLMEFIINMHQKRGENQRRDKVMRIIGLLEINSNNNEEIQREAAKVRKHRFLRAMANQYL